MRRERKQLAGRVSGKLRRAMGRVLSEEDAERLERLASREEWMARAGLVKLKSGDRSWYIGARGLRARASCREV